MGSKHIITSYLPNMVKRRLLSTANSIDTCPVWPPCLSWGNTPELSSVFISMLPMYSLFAKYNSTSNHRIYLSLFFLITPDIFSTITTKLLLHSQKSAKVGNHICVTIVFTFSDLFDSAVYFQGPKFNPKIYDEVVSSNLIQYLV